MRFLLLYLGEHLRFDKHRIEEILRSMPGASKVTSGPLIGACLEASFEFGGDSTLIRLKPDLETISLSSVGEAGLQAALEVQSRYPQPIHLVDSDYSFDVVLAEFRDLDSLRHSTEPP